MYKKLVGGLLFILCAALASGATYDGCDDPDLDWSGQGYSDCIEVVSCFNPADPDLSDSAHGRLTQHNTYYLLVGDISTPSTCIWYEADNSLLDLNGHTITYGDVGFDGIPNDDFELGSGTQADNWDFSNAPSAEWLRDDYIHISGRHLVKFTDIPAEEYIVSEWADISAVNITYEGYAIFNRCNTFHMEVESETGGTACSDSYRCTFKPATPDRYRLKLYTDRKNATHVGQCRVDLADIRPRQRHGVTMSSYTDIYRYPDYEDHSAHTPNNAIVKNGRIVEPGHGVFFGVGIFNFARSGGLIVDNIYSECHGLDCKNFQGYYAGFLTIRNSIANNTNTYTTNRHSLIGPVGLDDEYNFVYNNTFYGGQGNVMLSGVENSEVYNNRFYNYMTAVTNHYMVTLYAANNISVYNNYMEGATPGILFSSRTKNSKAYNNVINLTAMACDAEYATAYSTSAFRITDYGDKNSTMHNQIYNNVFYGRANMYPEYPSCKPSIRGFHISTGSVNNTYSHNYMEAISEGEAEAIVVYGGAAEVGHFTNNTFITNHYLAWLGNGYAASSDNAFFDSNTWSRYGTDPRFHTVAYGFWYGTNPTHSMNNTFLSNTYQGGSSLDDMFFRCNTRGHIVDWKVKWYLDVLVLDGNSPIEGQTVNVTSSLESLLGTTDVNGLVRFNLTQFYAYNPDAYSGGPAPTEYTYYTPHFVSVTYTDETLSQEVTMNKSMLINFTFESGPCIDGELRQCGISDIGACTYGNQTCTGGEWGECLGNVDPVTENCTNTIDDDCDGLTDYDDTTDCTAPVCDLPYDEYPCDCISFSELVVSLNAWYTDQLTLTELVNNIKTWKACSD